jgi:hypothetical protein
MLVVVVRAVGEMILDQFTSTQASVVRRVMVSVDLPNPGDYWSISQSYGPRCPIS